MNAGECPVFADHDADQGVLTARSVEQQVSLYTKAVIAAPVGGAMPDLKAISRVTEPRGIELRTLADIPVAPQREIANGIKGIGKELLLVDESLIADGRLAFRAALGELGVASEIFAPGYGFELELASVRRGRRRDYPGAQVLASRGLLLNGANSTEPLTEALIVEAARRCARQASFAFMAELPAMASRKQVGRGGVSHPLRIAI